MVTNDHLPTGGYVNPIPPPPGRVIPSQFPGALWVDGGQTNPHPRDPSLAEMVEESKTLEQVVDDRIADARKVLAGWEGVKAKLSGPGALKLTRSELKQLLDLNY